MSIVTKARAEGVKLVTRSGFPVVIYEDNANGNTQIFGSVSTEGRQHLCTWGIDGKHPNRKQFDLVMFSLEAHFPWDMLPGWANRCIFRSQGDWYCSSMPPTSSENNLFYVPRLESASYIIPTSIMKDIPYIGSDADSLTENPKYKEVGESFPVEYRLINNVKK